MITIKEQLKGYLQADRERSGLTKRHYFFGREIFKYLVSFRKLEFYTFSDNLERGSDSL